MYIGNNLSNSSVYISTPSCVVLTSPNPTMYQTTIIQDISCGGGIHQIASITITQNNYINLYFQPTIDFNAICNSFSLL